MQYLTVSLKVLVWILLQAEGEWWQEGSLKVLTEGRLGNEGRVTFRNRGEETANTFGQMFGVFFPQKVTIDETGNLLRFASGFCYSI